MKKIIVLIIVVILSQTAFGQLSSARSKIDSIIHNKELTIGLALYDLSNGDTLSINGDARFPMQSVFKLPIGLAVLHEVDNKKWELDQPILIQKAELHPETWSPIRDKYSEGNVRIPLSEILKYTISLSDNNGCDILLKMLGGPLIVERYIHDKGVTDIRIRNNELEMHSSWDIQFNNWATPKAMIGLLRLIDGQKLLLPGTQAFLWETMTETSTGTIKDKLPEDAIVGHKTGNSGTNKEGISAATNDVGIMVLPDGRHVAFAIFVTNSKEASKTNYAVIADIAKVIYDSTSGKD